MSHGLARLAAGSRLPGRTVRLRLTVLYGGLFLASGAVLLAVTYLLVAGQTVVGGFQTSAKPAGHAGRVPAPSILHSGTTPTPVGLPAHPQARFSSPLASPAVLHQLIAMSGVALAIMAVISVALGWLVAGQVLRPLRSMTATTRQITSANLHRRLALAGPRDELKDLGDTIDGLLGRLEESFEAQRRFVANASHELRTPLAMMRTSLDVAVAKPRSASPQLGTLAGKLREGLDQADRLLEGFLLLARAQYGAMTDRAIVSLPELLKTAIYHRADAILGKDIEVRQNIRSAEISGNETLLARMIENVIDNAIRHNERGGWIRAEAGTDGTVARLVVETGGPVLDETKVAGLAEPFRRLGTDRTGSQNGVGLGLSIVAAIAGAHGGSLRLHARPQGGLRVLIELPGAVQLPGVVRTTGAGATA